MGGGECEGDDEGCDYCIAETGDGVSECLWEGDCGVCVWEHVVGVEGVACDVGVGDENGVDAHVHVVEEVVGVGVGDGDGAGEVGGVDQADGYLVVDCAGGGDFHVADGDDDGGGACEGDEEGLDVGAGGGAEEGRGEQLVVAAFDGVHEGVGGQRRDAGAACR